MTAPIVFAMLQQAAGPNPYGTLFMFGSIFLIFYFLIIRPQQKQRKTHEEALRNLKRGDRIVTFGGIIADVVHIKEAKGEGGAVTRAMTDEVTIKTGDTRLIVERGRIAKIMSPSGETSESPDKKDTGTP